MVTKGSYCLCINIKKDSEIRIGSLGVKNFAKGRYIYVGSALNSLMPRIIRHFKTSRGQVHTVHWHIDYLLREPQVEIEAVYAIDSATRLECAIAAKIAKQGETVSRFGCSDCACHGHLFKVKSLEIIRKSGLKKMDLAKLTSSISHQ